MSTKHPYIIFAVLEKGEIVHVGIGREGTTSAYSRALYHNPNAKLFRLGRVVIEPKHTAGYVNLYRAKNGLPSGGWGDWMVYEPDTHQAPIPFELNEKQVAQRKAYERYKDPNVVKRSYVPASKKSNVKTIVKRRPVRIVTEHKDGDSNGFVEWQITTREGETIPMLAFVITK